MKAVLSITRPGRYFQKLNPAGRDEPSGQGSTGPGLPGPANSGPTRLRNILAPIGGLAVLAFVAMAVLRMGSDQQKASANTLTGIVSGRSFSPQREDRFTYGRGGLRTEHLQGEYVLHVYVEAEKRSFTVPVDEATYQTVGEGAHFTFIRPPSEQRR